jgi:hypothetical protein
LTEYEEKKNEYKESNSKKDDLKLKINKEQNKKDELQRKL